MTAVVLEGRSQADVARAYGVSKGWASKLVARYRAADHEAGLAGVTTQKLEILEGSHCLHRTQSPTMARTITEFIATHVTD